MNSSNQTIDRPAVRTFSTEGGGKYTVHDDPAVDACIEEDLRRITDHVESHYETDGVRSLVLVGGFGRGEGAVAKVDGAYRAQNDYDFVLVTNRKCDPDAIQRSRKELAEQIGIPWVDIVNYTQASLPRQAFTLFNYDFAHGSTVVCGDEDWRAALPQWSADAIPLVEAETLFFTRMWCFIGSYRVDFEKIPPTAEEDAFVYQQMAKAMLAYQDAHLLLIGAYDPSYRVRAERFKKEFPHQEGIFDLMDLAMEVKLDPPETPRVPGMEIFDRVRELYLNGMRHVGSALYNRPIHDSFDYERAYFGCPKSRWKRLKGIVRGHRYHQRTQAVNAAQLHLASCGHVAASRWLDGEAYTSRETRRAAELLRRLDPSIPDRLSWDELREQAAQLRMMV